MAGRAEKGVVSRNYRTRKAGRDLNLFFRYANPEPAERSPPGVAVVQTSHRGRIGQPDRLAHGADGAALDETKAAAF